MKLWMIGTPNCIKCKSMKPNIEEHCKENGIEFKYSLINELPKNIVDFLISKNVKSAPAFLIYKKDDEIPVVVTGDDVFIELEI